MTIRLLAIWIFALLASCVATKEVVVFADNPIIGPKEIALVGNRAPWVIEIERRLRSKGVKIKRFASLGEATQKISETRSETTTTTTTRVILALDGFAPNTVTTRCFGGGYNFRYINAELIDSETNETIAAYSNSGYSEGCQPLSGTIFGDITNMVNSAFR